MKIALEKKNLRKLILQKRRKLSQTIVHRQSDLVFEQLISLPVYKKAQCIMLYAALPDEVQTDQMMRYALQDGKQICIPYIHDKNGLMDAVFVFDVDQLSKGDFDILTINSCNMEFANPSDIDLMIIPGVAFDTDGYRLGMGAAFYDRFIMRAKQAFCLGIAFDCQLVSKVPIEEHDCSMDAILTASGLINSKEGKM
ncbi:5-formyltetrahydrofolate cyclo-ligase [Propionispira arboris]|uniref:5-formyltetrahydrofolate cyclo-ligase n=1 Tax=Propionispira arboris TaxID=84035 RepID=A0A1H6W6U3_9FIRM|nr:5-formyltetrahydrofolate cyclo-ligase [Propionispira arboris]SEJ12741.1 5-formyltetrahydrofolate cyclo-ligase [Propionispira arboris]